MTETQTKYRICPICEATCGLEIETKGRVVGAIRGNKEDVFSKGYICPKGVALRELDNDPDRLRSPMVRRGGEWVEVSWEAAFQEIETRLNAIVQAHGAGSVAAYLGNPSAHKVGLGLYIPVFLRALRTKQIYSASTLDQMPKQVTNGFMYGNILTNGIPDIDRSKLIVILGANPMASNGSFWTVPDFRGRVKAMQKRGGELIVIDPKQTLTAKMADAHHPIRPGTDALLLAAIAQTLFAEDLITLDHLGPHINGLDAVREAVADYTPEDVAETTGIAADDIKILARKIAASDAAAVYGRIGTCTQEFGSLASWLIDVINILTGNLDRPGGSMFPKAVALQGNSMGEPGKGRGVSFGRWESRVRKAPEVLGEFPAACLVEEIETPGDGQIRALFTIAGNPVLSSPDGERLGRALGSLDFMVSIDIYLSETSKFADVILPGSSPLEECQFDIAFNQLSIRNNARFSPAMFAPENGRPAEWEIMLRLAGIATGDDGTLEEADDSLIRGRIASLVKNENSSIAGRDPDEIFAALQPRTGPERQIDLAIRTGPHGDGFGANEDGLTLQKLIDNPNGFDLGALEPRMPDALRTPSGKIELAPTQLIADMSRLRVRLDRSENGDFLLIGRRDVRSNNSWLHNLPLLAKGPDKCTMQINPTDANRLGLSQGALARVSGNGASIDVAVEVTDAIMQGVVSIPHGYGHNQQGANLRVASSKPGVNSNLLANRKSLDPLSGTSVLNGIPVDVAAV